MMTRVLIIDDEEQFRSMLRQVLELSGYVVAEAGDGQQGLAILHQESADLVITDIIMPNKEGIETIFELKRDFPAVKIIAISGGSRQGGYQYLDQARHAGADHTLVKPFDGDELLQAIEALTKAS